MKNIRIILLLAIAAYGVSVFAGSQRGVSPSKPLKGSVPKALVIMLDGVRSDVLETARLKVINSLLAGTWRREYKCSYTFSALTIPDAPSSSAPNHAAIAMGVTAAKSKVFNNGVYIKKGDYINWPSWMARLAAVKAGAKTAFYYSWPADGHLCPTSSVEFVSGSDTVKKHYPEYVAKYGASYARDMANGAHLAKRLAAPDCIDAALVFFDIPDAGGHGAFGGSGTGFYPHSTGYLRAINACDKMIGDLLSSISSRPTFENEDWLIIITSDHGGYLTTHGIKGGHATSVPILVAGKNVKHGRIPGTPSICSVAPTVLEHFGVDTSGISFDGEVLGREVAEESARPLKDAL